MNVNVLKAIVVMRKQHASILADHLFVNVTKATQETVLSAQVSEDVYRLKLVSTFYCVTRQYEQF